MPDPTYRHRIGRLLRRHRLQLERLEELVARADASTVAPRQHHTERTSRSGYADPTLITVAERDDLLGWVEHRLWGIVGDTQHAAGRLGIFRPAPVLETRCCCPPACCPDGCTRPATEGRRWHDTCRKRRQRAADRGEDWANDVSPPVPGR